MNQMIFVSLLLADQVGSLRLRPQEEVRSQQLIPIGLPLDVYDDIYRDIAAEEHVRERAQLFTEQNGVSLTNEPHFFTSTDCSMFASAQICAEALQHKTFLASYPCSGNTWTRSMFEQTLLIYTGSVFCDGLLKQMGMHGECMQDPSKVFMVKTHWPVLGWHTEGNGEKNLIIVREPLHAALSWTTYMHGGADHHTEIPEELLREEFDKEAREKLKEWAHMAQVMGNRTDVHVVRYEDIVANTRDLYLTDIFPYVGVNPDNPDVIARLGSAIERTINAYSTTRRKHSYVFEFTDHHKKLAREIVGEDLAKHYGYQI